MIILGSGNMATNLAHAFRKAGVCIDCIYSYTLQHAQELAEKVGVECFTDDLADVNRLLAKDAAGQVVLYCLKDSVLQDVLAQIDAPEALHLHTAGSMGIEVFANLNKPHAGVLYFLQTFSREALIDDWSGIPCFFEGRNIDDVAAIYSLAQSLTSRIYECSQRDRERLHIAGVFANNYSNLMYRIAADILKGTQIPFEALLPLIDQTAAKVHALTPKDAQTGPAQRGDEAVMKHHLEILQATPYGEVYQALAALIEKGRNH